MIIMMMIIGVIVIVTIMMVIIAILQGVAGAAVSGPRGKCGTARRRLRCGAPKRSPLKLAYVPQPERLSTRPSNGVQVWHVGRERLRRMRCQECDR